MPTPRKGERRTDFLSRCMGSEEARKDFPKQAQRYAFCNSQWDRRDANDAERSVVNRFVHVGEDGTFSGYASVFGQIDSHGTKTRKGTFAEAIEERGPVGIKLTLQHDGSMVLGRLLEIAEDDYGLFIKGQLDLNVEKAVEVKSLMQSGALVGLSYGADNAEFDGDGLANRIDLLEISIVTFPSLETAHVDHKVIEFHDAITLEGVRMTGDGYMTATARVARTGIQEYKGVEVGRPDLDVVRVYRPETEVFSRDALYSFAFRPVTDEHPPERVTAKNWRSYTRGQTGGEVARDGDFIRVPMVLMDEDLITQVRNGKRQLSMGYTTDLKWESGRTPRGEQYDAIQTQIRANHLAVVAAARGGPDLRIGDDDNVHKEELDMDMKDVKSVTVDGVPIQVVGDVGQSVLNRFMTAMETQLSNLRAKAKEEEDKKNEYKSAKDAADAAHKTAIDAANAKITTLEQQVKDAQLSPDKLDAMVKDRTTIIDKAKALIGDKLVIDGKSTSDIKRQVIDAKLGDKAKGWSDEQVSTSFDTLAAVVKTDTAHVSGNANDSLSAALSDTAAGLDALYDKRDKDLSDAWKNPGLQPAASH